MMKAYLILFLKRIKKGTAKAKAFTAWFDVIE